jgi:hypothetical protein
MRTYQAYKSSCSLAASHRAPKVLRRDLAEVDQHVRARLASPSEDAGRGWRPLFPEGLTFRPVRVGRRHIWRAQAKARIGAGGAFTLEGDPCGSRGNLKQKVPVELVAVAS